MTSGSPSSTSEAPGATIELSRNLSPPPDVLSSKGTATMDQSTDVAVVGGGLAGLAAAAYLARAGRRVTVVEKASALGGRAATQEKRGFLMNMGAHALYLGGPARRVLDELGVEAPGRPPPPSGGLALREGRLHTLPTGFVSLLTTGVLDLSGKVELARLLASIRSVDTLALAGTSARAWLGQAFRSPAARGVLEMLFRVATYTADMDRLSAGAALRQLQLIDEANVRYVDRGWQTLVEGLRRAASGAGAVLATGERAASVRIEGGAARGVALADGTEIAAEAVILAVSPGAAAALAPELTALAQHAERATPVCAACLDLGLSRLPSPRALYAFGVERPLYLSVHSASARLAPEEGALVHLMKYLGEPGTEGEPERELEALMDQVQPGWREAVVERRFLPSMVVSNALVAAEEGGLAARPDAAVPGVRGLAIAGDWVGPEGMLADASLASARRAAELSGTEAGLRAAA
jgi:phytoene dehydrogenase-like protein